MYCRKHEKIRYTGSGNVLIYTATEYELNLQVTKLIHEEMHGTDLVF